MIIRDMNAKIGSDNTDQAKAIENPWLWRIILYDNGERLVEFCGQNDCFVEESIFPHKNIHKLHGNP